MMSPTAENVVGSATLVMARCGAGATAVTVALVRAVLTGLPPLAAWPVAVLVTKPRSTSAWTMAYVALHVILSPGARLAGLAGQVTEVLSSVTLNGPARVTLPSFVRA